MLDTYIGNIRLCDWWSSDGVETFSDAVHDSAKDS